MDFKDKVNKSTFTKEIDTLTKEYNTFFHGLIDSDNDKDYKKAALLFYWLRDFKNYIKIEDKFEPRRLIRYERGNIIKCNLGFNVGSEEGGMHYAVVVDKENAANSPVITVIPLTSKKAYKTEIHDNEIDLGDELYQKIKIKNDTMLRTISNKIQELKELMNTFKEGSRPPEIEKQINDQLDECEAKIRLCRKIQKEVNKMKIGSIALVSQLTTISKIRIYDPKNMYGNLSGIKLSKKSLDMLNEKIMELFVF